MDSVTAAEIAKLDTMTVSKLVEKFESLVGEKCRSRNKRYLIRRIGWRLQANAEGGLSFRTFIILQLRNELAWTIRGSRATFASRYRMDPQRVEM